MTQPIITPDLVLLDVDAGGDKEAVITRLVAGLGAAGRTSDTDGLVGAAVAREAQSATGLPGGIAIPHCRSPYVDSPTIGFARLSPKVDFGAPDGPADLAFLIAAPESGGAEHMKLLSSLAGRWSARTSSRHCARPTAPTRWWRSSTVWSIRRLLPRLLSPLLPPRLSPSSRSPPAPPALPTPTWRPMRSSRPPRPPG